ncbi:DUF58 domain-containing protein [Herbiconiux sp. L3-i23]|uniref:DUF58 domain-containing protein n=1 Tax=Herbiconiux sp. L3-i23 TaxID=2905871 RepID=UPI0020474F4B|nr:DUF58 domain-containing protein [Herbiconiux sp. L3-i23]BDI21812.1 hypothetical protein L3i23_05880 [Herbiconiux sp. L3-i23]
MTTTAPSTEGVAPAEGEAPVRARVRSRNRPRRRPRARRTPVRDSAPIRALHGPVVLVTSLLRAVGRVLHPIVTTVSPLGWVVVAATVASLAAGFVLGWQELVYLGLTLAAGLVVASLFLLGSSDYDVDIELAPHRVVAGERALGRLVVTGRKRRSAPTRIELPVGKGLAEFIIPGVAAGQEHEELFAVPTNRRAVIVAGPAVSVRGDQLGLIRRVLRLTERVELFVHPVTTRLDSSVAGLVRDLEGETSKKITNNDISFHALRAYEPGDDRRYVHWRTSARTGQLMVRQFEETRRSQLAIVLATDRRYYQDDDEFELAVSVAASLGAQVIRDGTRVDIVTEQLPLRTRSVTAMLDDSCRIEMTDAPLSARDSIRAATSRLAKPSVAMVIGGSRFEVGDFRSIEVLYGLDTQTVGFRIDASEPSRMMSVSGLEILSVAALADLPRLVRRVT